MTERAADDVSEIDKRIQLLKYERGIRSHVAGCAVVHGGLKADCGQCSGVGHCLLCKLKIPNSQSGANGCLICDLKGGTSFESCPK